MPTATQGFSGTEILNHVKNFTGNDSTDFVSYVTNVIPLAEFRFCKLHDWNFLHKQGLSLSVTNGTAEYTLSTTEIGYYMSAEDIETIYSPDGSVVLARRELKEIRRQDPEVDDGDSLQHAQVWAPVGDNKILFWPPKFKTETLKIDGKVSPNALLTLSNYPTIPYRYQESFIEYVIALALDRENDDRASAKKAEALALVHQDIQDDREGSGGTINPRFKHWHEARFDGSGANLEALLFGLVSFDYSE